MRKSFAACVERMAKTDERIIFLSGDLGYNALENLQQSLQERFINTGVAEQNMIGVAAGLAHKGFTVFCYSIAPFITYRCLEQIRIDVCFHQLPVFIVGNGGGYGYGIMGATHHALEDIACLSSLPGMTCHIPAFAEDVEHALNDMLTIRKPAYLRLGLGKKAPLISKRAEGLTTVFSSIASRISIIVLGPIINNVLDALDEQVKKEIDLFAAVVIPITAADDFFNSVRKTKKLIVVEEHVARGGLAEYLAWQLQVKDIKTTLFKPLHATGYLNGLYGDQSYHQAQSGLDSATIRKHILSGLNA